MKMEAFRGFFCLDTDVSRPSSHTAHVLYAAAVSACMPLPTVFSLPRHYTTVALCSCVQPPRSACVWYDSPDGTPEDASEDRGVSSFGFTGGESPGGASEKARVTTFRFRRPGKLTERQKRCVGTYHYILMFLLQTRVWGGAGGVSV